MGVEDSIENLHDFFVAAAGVAGALIGLLFVAISVSAERLAAAGEGPLHRIRATAALTSFTNALVVSLFGLIPHTSLGKTAVWISCVGLISVVAMLLSLVRARAIRPRTLLDLTFLIGLAVVFGVQFAAGLRLDHGHAAGAVQTLAVLVVVCFLVGIGRAWELIGGPSTGIGNQLRGIGEDVVRSRRDT